MGNMQNMIIKSIISSGRSLISDYPKNYALMQLIQFKG